MLKQTNSVNNGAREVEFGSFGGVDDYEHNRDGFAKVSKIFVTQDNFF